LDIDMAERDRWSACEMCIRENIALPNVAKSWLDEVGAYCDGNWMNPCYLHNLIAHGDSPATFKLEIERFDLKKDRVCVNCKYHFEHLAFSNQQLEEES